MKKPCVNLVVATVVFIVYLAGCTRNEPPVIDRFVTDPASDTLVTAGDTVKIICEATDPDGDLLAYEFEADGGTFEGPVDANDILWIAPDHSGIFEIICTVSDGDTLHEVADTITIHVQNYLPMTEGNQWVYEGKDQSGRWALLRLTVVDRKVDEGRIRCYVERYIEGKYPVPVTDTGLVYTIAADSVFIKDPDAAKEYLGFLLPFLVAKSWETGDGGTGRVVGFDSCEVKAGLFEGCVNIKISGGQLERDLWLAPDVGIIVTQLKIDDPLEAELELVEYHLK
ncbi:hypothetical protein CEE36_10390 [candidate division TA06 bacterium B3_TA06]|uniref:Uncharacterized protein n=1 Tax=candidate division TA06 bacterium B3_TA06 TaxID=2012487 RepID=A0A532UW90_UNCT6|nr:MAG: hypothetical protein CEE36_10390 [candidate division TA06 bacterium B3_TA06]